ncbi:MAG: amidase [Rhizobiaceae bacterium]
MTKKPKNRHGIGTAGDICRMPATELAAAIRAKDVSAREAVSAFLDRIDQANGAVNAVVSLRERAELLKEADAADAALAGGATPGPLFGLPVAVKDLAQTKGIRTTFGSPIFKDNVPDVDELFVGRMKAAGAIVIGKTNTPEFGLGSHTFNPVFGPTRNAFDPRFSAGGSSGGAAVALALDMLPLSDGSDFGGSLRNPAGWNNVFGLRPSQGRVPGGPDKEVFVSQMGLDGPMARNVGDLALLLSVQAGYDRQAPLSLGENEDFVGGLAMPAPTGLRIGWMGDMGGRLPMEDGVLAVCGSALDRLEAGGFHVEPVVPDFDLEGLWRAFVTLRHSTSGCGLKAHYDNPAERSLLKPEAVFEVEGALRLTAPEIHAASATRSNWYRAVQKLFERFDLLALPTAQLFPFPIEDHWPKAIAGRTMDSYHRWLEVCSYATLAACPAAAVPAGFDAEGRPMGLQLIGPPRADMAVLRAALAYERLMDWTPGAG